MSVNNDTDRYRRSVPRAAGETPHPERVVAQRKRALKVAVILGIIVLGAYLGSIAWYVLNAPS